MPTPDICLEHTGLQQQVTYLRDDIKRVEGKADEILKKMIEDRADDAKERAKAAEGRITLTTRQFVFLIAGVMAFSTGGAAGVVKLIAQLGGN